jgi:uncharacterized membrane protein YkvA (DUF1232 family)
MRPWLLRTAWREVRLAARLLRDPRVPLAARALLPVALLYVISPVDILPDFIPGIGQVDDLVLLYAAVRLFLRVAPAAATAFHRDALDRKRPYQPMPPDGEVIDADYRRD